jgi:hypothetical protein
MRLYNNKYLSVTSIIELREPFKRESFIKWCEKNGLNEKLISKTSSVLGEKVAQYLDNIHRSLESITEPPVGIVESRLRSGVDKFLQDWNLIDTEKEVTCETLNYAGRFDGIIESKVSGEKLLVDWKTFGAWKEGKYKRDSKKIKHATWQLSLYANAIGWKDGLAVVVFTSDGEAIIEKVKYNQEMIDWVVANQNLILSTIKNEQDRCSGR